MENGGRFPLAFKFPRELFLLEAEATHIMLQVLGGIFGHGCDEASKPSKKPHLAATITNRLNIIL